MESSHFDVWGSLLRLQLTLRLPPALTFGDSNCSGNYRCKHLLHREGALCSSMLWLSGISFWQVPKRLLKCELEGACKGRGLCRPFFPEPLWVREQPSVEEFPVAAFIRNPFYVLDWSCISGCLLCIFKTELQMHQDGCYVPGLGNLGGSAWPFPFPKSGIQALVTATLRKGSLRPSFYANGFLISHWFIGLG